MKEGRSAGLGWVLWQLARPHRPSEPACSQRVELRFVISASVALRGKGTSHAAGDFESFGRERSVAQACSAALAQLWGAPPPGAVRPRAAVARPVAVPPSITGGVSLGLGDRFVPLHEVGDVVVYLVVLCLSCIFPSRWAGRHINYTIHVPAYVVIYKPLRQNIATDRDIRCVWQWCSHAHRCSCFQAGFEARKCIYIYIYI